MIIQDNEKLMLHYPCDWQYSLVCLAKKNIENIVLKIIKNRDFKLKMNKKSKKGKYHSYNLILLVFSDYDRKNIFKLFKDHEQIYMVL